MSSLSDNYIADTFDGLLHSGGDPLPASGLTPIYDGLGNQSSLSLGRTCNGAKICGELTVGSLVIENDDIEARNLEQLNRFFPIGSVYFSAIELNPGYTMGGRWLQIGNGMFLAGVGTGTDANGATKSISAGANSGEYTHKLLESELPTHTHTGISVAVGAVAGATNTDVTFNKILGKTVIYHENNGHTSNTPTAASTPRNDGELIIDATGSGDSHNNTPPSFGLYIWKRTA